MTSGQVLTSLVFLAVGCAAVVYGVSLWSMPLAWVVGGAMAGMAGFMPMLRGRI